MSPAAQVFERIGTFHQVLAFLLCLASYILYTKWRRSTKYSLPPGPTGWPIIGYIDFVLSDKPAKLLAKVKEKYGNVFGFHVGNQYCVVLSDFASVKEGFCKKSLLARPPGYFRTSADCKNFSEMEGPHWEVHRKFFSSCLKCLGVGKSRFEEIVLDDLSRAMSRLKVHVGGAECNVQEALSPSLNNTTFQMICSSWFEDDHPFMKKFTKFLHMSAESFSNNTAVVYFPSLDWLLNRFHPHSVHIHQSLSDTAAFLQSEIESREITHNENSVHDYLDLYLNEMKSGKHGLDFFNKEHLVANSLLLLMSGSDRPRNTLVWMILAMARFQDVQEKVYNEIQSAVGTEKAPLLSDKVNLPYTEATIMESQRWKTLVPLNCLRYTLEDTVLQGYKIPKNTIVMNNLYNCHMDPTYWECPKDFNPERFLNGDKRKVVVPEYYMPFSLGKRNCPADRMAFTEIFMYFTRIIQKFRILPPDGGVSFKASHRVNIQAEKPFVKLSLR